MPDLHHDINARHMKDGGFIVRAEIIKAAYALRTFIADKRPQLSLQLPSQKNFESSMFLFI
jgi:hypothetical protein